MSLKRILLATALAGTAAAASLPAQAAQVGVSIGFAAPGAFGRVDIGRFPAPRLVSHVPVVVGARVAVREPVYLWVPPAHRVRWADYCASYGACGVPVYFVDDGWYRQTVYPVAAPAYVPTYGPTYYAPRPVVYAPRPVVYAPPVVVGGYWRDGRYWRDGHYWHDGHWYRPGQHDGHPYKPYFPNPPGPPGSHDGHHDGGRGGDRDGGWQRDPGRRF